VGRDDDRAGLRELLEKPGDAHEELGVAVQLGLVEGDEAIHLS
jgi:hypothetical protein